jgi:hypothetical protein
MNTIAWTHMYKLGASVFREHESRCALVWRMLVSSRVGQHILCMHGGSVDTVREISYSDGCQEMGPLRTYS